MRGGLTLTRSAAFTDANGAAMSKYNDTTTASANFQLAVSGVHQTLFGADTISRQRSMTATGLLGRETSRTWNGTGPERRRLRRGRRVDAHVQDAGCDDHRERGGEAPAQPESVAAERPRDAPDQRHGHRVGERREPHFTFEKTVTITFNGTRLVPMKVGDVSFVLDLHTGRAAKA